MTPEAQRIAIAEACGWKLLMGENWREHQLTRPDGRTTRPCDPRINIADCLPDYLNDLNAMHEAEKVLLQGAEQERRHKLVEYSWKLREVTLRTSRDGSDLYERLITATASDRAEAFLRTLGKWTT